MYSLKPSTFHQEVNEDTLVGRLYKIKTFKENLFLLRKYKLFSTLIFGIKPPNFNKKS